MPRYHFNVRIGADVLEDTDGRLLRDPDQAWQVARDIARELLDDPDTQAQLLRAVIEVSDSEDEVVLEFPMVEALSDGSGPPSIH